MSKKLIFKNDANTTLAVALIASDTQVVVSSSSALPNITSDQYYYITVQSIATGAVEHMKVTAKTGNTLTVIRGVDGSLPGEFAIGAYVGMRVISAQFNDMITRITSPDNITISNPGASYTPDLSTSKTIDLYGINSNIVIQNPPTIPENFTRMLLRLRTDGSQHNISFGSKYTQSTAILPTYIPASVSQILGFIYNARLDTWECTTSESLGDALQNFNMDTHGNANIAGSFTSDYLYPNHALGILFGGTGATTKNDALNNLLPTQTGNIGKYLLTDGNNASWSTLNLSVAAITSGTISGLSSLGVNGTSNLGILNTSGKATLNSLEVTGNATIDGNLTVNGTYITQNTETLSVQDNLIYLNEGSPVANPDLGLVGNYNDGTYHHTGVFRDASDGYWKFFKNYVPEPNGTININDPSFALADVQAANFRGNLIGNASTATYAISSGTATNVAYSGLTGTVPTWNQDTTGNAATATNPQSGGTFITSSNIGNQSVNYAATAGSVTIANSLNISNNYQVNSLGAGVPGSGTPGEIRASDNLSLIHI